MSSRTASPLEAAVVELANTVDDVQARLAGADTHAERLAAVTELLELEGRVLELRTDLARELRRAGLTLEAIAELAGVTRARISQLLGRPDELELRRIRNNQPTRGGHPT